MATLADDVDDLMARYHDRIIEGQYNPDPEGIVRDHIQRRGLESKCAKVLLPPFRRSIRVDRFVQAYMLNLARLAYAQRDRPRNPMSVSSDSIENLAEKCGARDIIPECVNAARLWTERLCCLIRLAAGGDKASRDELVAVTFRWLRPHMSQILSEDVRRSIGSTGDLMGDWAVLVLKGFKRFLPNDYSEAGLAGHFLSFVVAREWFAKKARDRQAQKQMPHWPFPEQDSLSPPDEQPTAEEVVLRRERCRSVTRAVEQLREPYRTVIRLIDFDGRRVSEVAEFLEVTEGAVKGYHRRAKQAVKELLRDAD
jgi:RNA polymerase sigma factor (sigma-70 family)